MLAIAIKQIEKNDPTLQTLDLGYNNFGPDGVHFLAEALNKNTTLQSLNLGWNKLGSDGAQFLAEALSKNTALHTLDLKHNNLGPDDVRAFDFVNVYRSKIYTQSTMSFMHGFYDSNSLISILPWDKEIARTIFKYLDKPIPFKLIFDP